MPFVQNVSDIGQEDWKDVYNATIDLYLENKKVDSFRASTLPNFLPGSGHPPEWKYSIVMATCAFPDSLKNRYYTWVRGKREDGKSPCLRFSGTIPTVNIGSERYNEMKDIIKVVFDENEAKKYHYATNILLHSGYKQTWRGSHGCLTIHPDDSDRFFDKIPEGEKGTLELIRGIHDDEARQSYCY